MSTFFSNYFSYFSTAFTVMCFSFFSRRTPQHTDFNEELASKERELSNYLLKLARNQELLSKIESTIANISGPISDDVKVSLKEIKSIINEGKNQTAFKEFDVSYQQLNPAFFKALSSKHDGLTAGELRLASLLKLNLSTKEIASLTFKNPVSVKTARTRLRKKLQLTDREVSLSGYLNSL